MKKNQDIEVHYDSIKKYLTLNDKKKGVIIVLDEEYLERIMDKICFGCKWVIT